MNAQISRVQFLRGDFKGTRIPLRPPWAIAESLFTEICTGCGNCVTQCPSHIIKLTRTRYPVIDFSVGECVFCEHCVEACEPDALLKTGQHNLPWHIKASINQDVCIAHQGVECRSCYDPCELRAITMPPRLGGISIPVINSGNCSGCAACYSVCPAQAISMAVSQ